MSEKEPPTPLDIMERLISEHRPGDSLPGNRSPRELAGMLQYMAISHPSFGWASWMYYAAATIQALCTDASEKAWKAKHGPSCFASENIEQANRRVLADRLSFLAYGKVPGEVAQKTASFTGADPAVAIPGSKPARAVLAPVKPPSAPPRAQLATAPLARAKLKPETGGGFF